MEDRDPTLFLKKKTGKFNAYSRICPSNVKRPPVILTKAEKDRIDKKNPGSYDGAIKYGSDPKNPYYYICPRYWCLKDNTSLTEEDVKAGKCGGKIIPSNAKKVPKDAFIMEFTSDKHKDKDGKYVKHYPGFIPNSHPDGHCLPCCFKQWDSPEQIKRRELCNQDKSENEKEEYKRKTDIDEYIKAPDKFPLDRERWGYLPIILQKFLHIDNTKCQVSNCLLYTSPSPRD